MIITIEIEYPGKYMPDAVGDLMKKMVVEEYDANIYKGEMAIRIKKTPPIQQD